MIRARANAGSRPMTAKKVRNALVRVGPALSRGPPDCNVDVARPRPPPALTPERVFREYVPRVYNVARRLLGNDADAEDVTQDVFVQVIRKLDTFRGEAALPTWLYRVTLRAAWAQRRKRAQREKREVHDAFQDFEQDGGHRAPVRRWVADPVQLVLDREAHQRVEEAIARLPEIYRDVFVLADVEEMPTASIAGAIGQSTAAVKSRLHRARLLIRKALAPYFKEKVA